MFTESQVIQTIHELFPTRPEITPLGIGDDCAQLAHPGALVTTDASVEGVHFDLAYVSLAEAAYRCLASNLSDIAAMGAYTTGWTLALGLKPSFDFKDIVDAIHALKQCLLDHQLPDAWLVGGDVVCAPNAIFSITAWGECRANEKTWSCITRSGAKVGDNIAVFGWPGRAAVGLKCLMTTNRAQCLDLPTTQAFLHPRALTQLGPALAQAGLVSAMMDTSDGVYTDLPRLIAQSHVGAIVDIDAFQNDDAIQDALKQLDVNAPNQDLSQIFGGEDYGLLATLPPNKVDWARKLAYSNNVPMTLIGVITDSKELIWRQNKMQIRLKDQSFKHFSG